MTVQYTTIFNVFADKISLQTFGKHPDFALLLQHISEMYVWLL